MPEIKNTFLKSKMNQDLDERLIEKGEYREGKNISINKSEGPNVGALENVLGNTETSKLGNNIQDVGSTGKNYIQRDSYEPLSPLYPPGGFPIPCPSSTNDAAVDPNSFVRTKMEVIGSYVDTQNNRIYYFLTDYTDCSPQLTARAPSDFYETVFGYVSRGAICQIVCYNTLTQDTTILVEGSWLNFSTTNYITGVNLLEDVLAWTDNRNQPRKINVDFAFGAPACSSNPYYQNEDHVSVAKYAPVEVIDFQSPIPTTALDIEDKESLLKDKVSQWNPPHFLTSISNLAGAGAGDVTLSDAYSFGVPSSSDYLWEGNGYCIKCTNVDKPNSPDVFIQSLINPPLDIVRTANITNNAVIVDVTTPTYNWEVGDKLRFCYSNVDFDLTFPGDENYLKDKFPRFSYRFKYDDGEYSLMAPFTQAAFVPGNNGFFINNFDYDAEFLKLEGVAPDDLAEPVDNCSVGDEKNAAETGVVDFMENKINSIGLKIDLPTTVDKLTSEYKVDEIQILFKDANEQSIKVVEDISSEIFSQPPSFVVSGSACGNNYFDELTTLYIEETLGAMAYAFSYLNNGIYTDCGTDTYAQLFREDGITPLLSIDGEPIYLTSIFPPTGYCYPDCEDALWQIGFEAITGGAVELPVNALSVGEKIVIKAQCYPDHYIFEYNSIKPYKVLPEADLIRVSDRVPVAALSQEIVSNRIVYGNYLDKHTSPLYLDYEVDINVRRGVQYEDSDMKALPLSTLKQNRTYQVGVVLQDRYGRASSVTLRNPAQLITDSFSNDTVFAPYSFGQPDPVQWFGNSLKINFNNPIPSDGIQGYPGLWSEDNPLGWYSYKIVVKQQDHDYYNVYVPGATSGKITWDPIGASAGGAAPANRHQLEPRYINTTVVSNISLFGDNINKVPKNLNDPGPVQEVFGSEEVLWNIVMPNYIESAEISNPLPYQMSIWVNQQFSPNSGVSYSYNYNKANVTTLQPWNTLGEWTNRKRDTDLEDQFYPYYIEDITGNADRVPVDPIFKADDNPYVAELSTQYQIGLNKNDQQNFPVTALKPLSFPPLFSNALTVFETTPVHSNLEIYWETSSSGLISDLNQLIDDGYAPNGVYSLPEFTSSSLFTWSECTVPGTEVTPNSFEPFNESGFPCADPAATCALLQSNNGDFLPADLIDVFEVFIDSYGANGQPLWKLRLKPGADPNVFIANDLSTNPLQFIFLRLIITANGTTKAFDRDFLLDNCRPVVTVYNGQSPQGGATQLPNGAALTIESDITWQEAVNTCDGDDDDVEFFTVRFENGSYTPSLRNTELVYDWEIKSVTSSGACSPLTGINNTDFYTETLVDPGGEYTEVSVYLTQDVAELIYGEGEWFGMEQSAWDGDPANLTSCSCCANFPDCIGQELIFNFGVAAEDANASGRGDETYWGYAPDAGNPNATDLDIIYKFPHPGVNGDGFPCPEGSTDPGVGFAGCTGDCGGGSGSGGCDDLDPCTGEC